MKTAVILLALVGACVASALPKAMPPLLVEPLPEAVVQKPQRIISGTPATVGQFPYQAALSFNGWFCGGSLITKRTILTAAHCTDGASSVTAYLGAVSPSSGQAYTSRTFRQHPNYNGQQIINDVAVVIFSQDIQGANIGTIQLASGSDNYAGQTATASGYGLTRDGGSVSQALNYARVNVITPAACSAVYGSNTAHASVICTRGPGTAGVCSGDSGGPLALNGVQIGVVSFAAANACQYGYPSGYARVTNLRSWIDQNTV